MWLGSLLTLHLRSPRRAPAGDDQQLQLCQRLLQQLPPLQTRRE
jgi:hypothetical protein